MLSDVYSYNTTNFLGLQIINYVSFSVFSLFSNTHFCSLKFLSHVVNYNMSNLSHLVEHETRFPVSY